MSAWREALQPASFRGVPFWVDADGVPVGRRTQVHEYPQRDEPFVEDLGRRTRQFRMAAFVIGGDCLQQRDALLEALDTPGEGELVHPWLGRLKVTPADCEMSHDRREGGMVRFDLLFIEAGALAFPAATANTQLQAAAAADTVWASALSRFDRAMAMIDRARININAARGALSAVQAMVQQQFGAIGAVFDSAAALVDAIITAPSSVSGAFASYFGARTLPSSGYTTALSAIASATDAAGSLSGVTPAGGADTAGAIRAVADLAQDAALFQAAKDVAQLQAVEMPPATTPPAVQLQAAKPPEAPEVPVADDVIAVRDALGAAMWQAALRAPHDHFQALSESRLQTDRHLTAVAAAGVRLESLRPLQPMPAIVLAYRRFGDANRAGEIVTRNRIAHPGFVPAAPLQVAAE